MTLPSKVALGTMHRKEAAIAPPFMRLGINLTVPESFDTDRFGTFSGEVARAGTMEDAARAKALAASDATGLTVGLGSEGAYGPHPTIPFIPAGIELLLWRDNETGHEIIERLVDDAPVYDHVQISDMNEIDPFLTRVGFPETGLIVAPLDACSVPLAKGVLDINALAAAIATAQRKSADGLAFVQTDMRAHMNPRRMQTIARLADRLANRLARACPQCDAPGWGLLRTEIGLPCSWCGEATQLVACEIHGCTACGTAETHPRPDGLLQADPGACPWCNP